MLFTQTKLAGAYLVEPEFHRDARGSFARTFCQDEFKAHGLNSCIAQCNVSFNEHEGTLRGMHYQVAPHAEAKFIRCTSGAIYDVIVDLRPESSTFRQWLAVELSAENHMMLYIPEQFGHGFQTLQNHTEVFYQMSEFYHAGSARGFRWNDPAFAITWPLSVRMISDRDQNYPDWTA